MEPGQESWKLTPCCHTDTVTIITSEIPIYGKYIISEVAEPSGGDSSGAFLNQEY